jgi:catechol 2,3-dioxygenase-like lactoylglutathione lyase family enzyme
MITDLDHLVLTVRDLAATRRFYMDGLGMRLVTFDQGRQALHFGSHKINLHVAGHEFEPKAAHPTPGSGDLCFLTERPLAEIAERLASLGFPLIEGAPAFVPGRPGRSARSTSATRTAISSRSRGANDPTRGGRSAQSVETARLPARRAGRACRSGGPRMFARSPMPPGIIAQPSLAARKGPC